ncbi:MFS transporter [Sciscionella sediminilitoris]|uniref:MFS transporter n=1 Tax=Sciscionella sediminilitoris TaxID=1445613 RepID=UPI0004DF6813|nr:MFS transporter [Sciscionella sp. SE31]
MSTPAQASTSGAERTRGLLRPVIGASIGNAIEWFDYSVYGYLSASIATVFFPKADPSAALLSTFAAFAVAFLARPFGGLFFGSLGDRLGRRNVLATVVLLVSGSAFAVGLLPGYQSIGVAAPILLVLLRLLQGFSAGGEVAGSTAFLAEYAPDRRRGYWISFQNFSAFCGALLGSALVTVLTSTLGQDVVTAWAWRIPFLVAAPLGLAALYLRLRLDDTPAFARLREQGVVAKAPLRETVRGNGANIARAFALSAAHNVPYYLILTYIPTYLATHTDLLGGSFLAAGVALLVAILVLPLAGRISDRIGRRPVAAAAALGYVVLSYPLFVLLNTGDLTAVLLGQAVLGVLFGTFGSAPFAMMVELFPTRTRYSAMSVGYNLAAAALGGTAPLIASLLVEVTGDSRSPAYYLIAGALLALVAIRSSPETARDPLR